MKLVFSQRRKRYEQIVAKLFDYAQMSVLGSVVIMLGILMWHNFNL